MFPTSFLSNNAEVIPSELGVLLTAALVAAAIAILLVGRREADAGDGRLGLRYFGVICLVTLFVTLFAAFNTARALTDLVVDHRARAEEKAFKFDPTDPEAFLNTIMDQTKSTLDRVVEAPYASSPDNNANYTAAVQSGLVALATGAVFMFHFRRRRELAAEAGDRTPAARVERTYEYGVCFLAALIVAYAAARSLFGVYQLAFPGTAGDGNPDVLQQEGISAFLAYGLLALAAGGIFRIGWARNAPAAVPATTAKRAPAKKSSR
jgi:hypothetical protein